MSLLQQRPVIFDIAGTTLNAADRRRLAHPLTGGLILFTRNWVDRRQLVELLAEVRGVREDLLICIDHEGGRVQRLRTDGYTRLPPMRRCGELWAENPVAARGLATAVGYVLASELRACGIDFSFTPVLDLDHGHSSVIGDRAFHADPRVVAELAQCVMHGLLLAGMSNCGKHFPGHGHVAADSHVDVPVDNRSRAELLALDALPYLALRGVLGSVMPAHVIYPAVDSLPAGYSRRWLQDILRGELGFLGAVFSDDLSMEGGRYLNGQLATPTEAAVAALNAGCDLVLFCNQSLIDAGEPIDRLLDGLEAASALGLWQPSPASEARRAALLPHSPPLAWDDLMRHGPYLQALDRLSQPLA